MSMKHTKISELEISLKNFMDETVRLRNLLEQSNLRKNEEMVKFQ